MKKSINMLLKVMMPVFLGSQTVLAQFLAPIPVASVGSGKTLISPFFSDSEIDYDVDDTNIEIDRSILGVGGTFAMAPNLNLIGSLGFGFNGEIHPGRFDDGTGFHFGIGAEGRAWHQNNLSLNLFGLYTYSSEDFKYSGTKLEIKASEMHFGGQLSVAIENKFFPYVGLVIVPYSDGEARSEGGGKTDIDRDDRLGLKLGAQMNLSSALIGLDITVAGEQGFMVWVTFPL